MSRFPPRGRFAPSPTGPLHFGSLIAAVASYLSAKTAGGEWLVRVEDIDPPREQPGASDLILRSLEAHGLKWDGSIMYQRHRADAYYAQLDRLRATGLTYYCNCSRKDLHRRGRTGRYPGYCRDRRVPPAQASLRIRTPDEDMVFADRCQGRVYSNLQADHGDFVVHRRDGLFAYQLAVVVDDAEQGITEVVRGSDLLDSTPRQIFLQRCLGYATPAYLHHPVAVSPNGEKLSKQTGARALDDRRAVDNLIAVLHFLGQRPPGDLAQTSPDAVMDWARANWNTARIPSTRLIDHEES